MGFESKENNQPLVSFCLLAYNQENYIRAALKAAFLQTYSPLEFILSDDCSTDHTYEIMEEAAANYKGPHRVILNRNPKNLGLSEHVNQLFVHSRGDLLILAAGDDVSHENRAEVIVRYWRKYDFTPLGFTSECYLIDSDGVIFNRCPDWKNQPELNADPIQEALGNYKWNGCAGAYSRKLFDFFGPLPRDVAEDEMLYYRAHLLGSTVFVPEVLVDYRVWVGSLIGTKDRRRKAMQTYFWRWGSVKQLLKDMALAHSSENSCFAFLSKQEKALRLAVHVSQSGTLGARFVSFFRLCRLDWRIGVNTGRFLFPTSFEFIYRSILSFCYFLNAFRRRGRNV